MIGNRISKTFDRSRREGKLAFIPFITAGDPDLQTTVALVESIAARCAEASVPTICEIGFPYSDPIADGPVIQESYHRALTAGVRVDAVFEAVKGLRAKIESPIVGMVSHSLVHRRGVNRFATEAKNAGFDGLIVPDLPLEESASAKSAFDLTGLCLIPLVAPTTPSERIDSIVAQASGFIYCVAVTGITGARVEVADSLFDRIGELRKKTELPICVGFGISRPEHISRLRGRCDGVIVGSALVKMSAKITAPGDSGFQALESFARELIAATK